MSSHELTTIDNPQRDRSYRVTLRTDHPLPCKSADCDVDGLALLELHYSPLELCIETRSFGHYLSQLLNSRTLDQDLVRQMVNDVMECCRPSAAQVNVQFESAAGRSIGLSANSGKATQ